MVQKHVINPGWSIYESFPGSAPAIRVGNLLFISGCAAIDPQGNVVGKGDIRAQTRQTMENMKAVLEAAGATFDNVVETTTFITDIRQLGEAIAVRSEYLRQDSPTAGTSVEVSALGLEGLMIEIRAIAVLSE